MLSHACTHACTRT